MNDLEETKICPFCSESILITAKKCKHCGEWLENAQERKGTNWDEKGSVDARSVTKGLKQKEQDDFNIGCLGIIIFFVSVGIGIFISNSFNSSVAGFIIGTLVFIILNSYLVKKYHQE